MIMLCAETGPAVRAARGVDRPATPIDTFTPHGLPIRVERPRIADDDDVSIKKPGGTAIVLGGGGVLGAVQVLRALIEVGVRPSLVVGTSGGSRTA
jgi:predicted acylesterase/phospholipase RssA